MYARSVQLVLEKCPLTRALPLHLDSLTASNLLESCWLHNVLAIAIARRCNDATQKSVQE
jgi:hypothetical protein